LWKKRGRKSAGEGRKSDKTSEPRLWWGSFFGAMNRRDTIAAISTPLGTGGISVIRVSGEEAIAAVDRLFRGKRSLAGAPSHTAHHGYIVDPAQSEEALDEVVVTVFRKPHSYTGEDVVEISCHGGVYVTRRILEAVLDQGVRLAEPGEFTKRAFLNGRMDLAQAEAVADLIQAKTALALRSTLRQLKGELSERIRGIKNRLVGICANLELDLDFVEEDIQIAPREEQIEALRETLEEVEKLIASYRRGRFLREGVRMAIVGKPNVGKSSLLNALLGRERAIVDETPGTTRDTIEELLDIDGLLFQVVDTAGLRKARDRIEAKGMERTQWQIESSHIILFMLDGSEELTEEDQLIWSRVQALVDGEGGVDERAVVVIKNKIDLPQRLELKEIKGLVGDRPLVSLSAKTGEGLEELNRVLKEVALAEEGVEQSVVVTNQRHLEALKGASRHLRWAIASLEQGYSYEFVVVDLRGALNRLGEIIGETTTEDILEHIFSHFCIGK